MSKTIKVIDLLNKIANGEEVPEKIKWRDKIWIYTKSQQDYLHNEVCFFEGFCQIRTKEFITDTVEIIEEQEEIDIQSIKEFDRDKAREEIFTYTESNGGKSNLYCFSLFTESCIIPKINELVQAVKQLDKK